MRDDYTILEEYHDFTIDEKLKWFGYGEWIEEPDYIKFEYLGYDAAICRVCTQEPLTTQESYAGGHLCGYVQIPRNHPYFKKDALEMDIDAHGGLTYNQFCFDHWIGFDCAHSGDIIPSLELFKKKYVLSLLPDFKNFIIPRIYKNIEFCMEICFEIIDKLILVNVSNEIKKINDYEK